MSLDEADRAITVLPARRMILVLNTLVDLLRLDSSLDLQISNVTSTSYQEIQGLSMPGRTAIGGVELVVRRPAVR